jgi:hypothetical protein
LLWREKLEEKVKGSAHVSAVRLKIIHKDRNKNQRKKISPSDA